MFHDNSVKHRTVERASKLPATIAIPRRTRKTSSSSDPMESPKEDNVTVDDRRRRNNNRAEGNSEKFSLVWSHPTTTRELGRRYFARNRLLLLLSFSCFFLPPSPLFFFFFFLFLLLLPLVLAVPIFHRLPSFYRVHLCLGMFLDYITRYWMKLNLISCEIIGTSGLISGSLLNTEKLMFLSKTLRRAIFIAMLLRIVDLDAFFILFICQRNWECK